MPAPYVKLRSVTYKIYVTPDYQNICPQKPNFHQISQIRRRLMESLTINP